MSNPLILPCPDCRGTYNGTNRTHSHTDSRAGAVDERFLGCVTCRGRGAITCDVCNGKGRVTVQDGKIIGTVALDPKPTLEALAGLQRAKRGNQ